MRPLYLLVLLIGFSPILWSATNPATELATRLLAQARQAAELPDRDAALQLLQRLQALDAAPAALRGRGLMLMAWLRAQAEQPQLAAEAFAGAARNPALTQAEQLQARIGAASLWLSLDQAETALAQLAAEPDDPQEQALRGRSLLRLQRYGPAAELLQSAIQARLAREQAVDPAWRQEALSALLALEHWPQAARQLRALLVLEPRNAQWWRLLGDTLLQQQLPEAAAGAWQTALQTGLDQGPHRRDLARLYLNLQLPSRAFATLAAKPASAEDHALLAEALQRMRQDEQALEHWRQAYALSRESDYLLAVARLLSEQENWREADQAWQQLQSADVRTGADDQLLAAISAFRSDRRQSALDQLAVLRKDPQLGETAAQWLDYLRALEPL